jgi:hypothetical protein
MVFVWFFVFTFMIMMPYMINAGSLYESEVFLKRKEFTSFAVEHGTAKPIVFLPKGVLNILDIEIGRDSISRVLSKLGDAYLSKEHGESGNYGLCYRSIKEKDNTILIFETGPSGGWNIINGFSLFRNDSQLFERCISSNYVSADVKLDAGLRLGMTEDELSSIMQTPSAIREEWRGYIYTGKQKIKEIEFDVIVSILVRIINSKVIEIWISRGEWS